MQVDSILVGAQIGFDICTIVALFSQRNEVRHAFTALVDIVEAIAPAVTHKRLPWLMIERMRIDIDESLKK